MDLALLDWLNLIGRWIHLIVGIAWIGSSFYFVWQDNSLEPTADDPDRKRLHGEIWMVHGGGFYHAKKYKVAPPDLPAHLHWFKWEAYSTWMSGMALLAIVYYLSGPAIMLPPGSGLGHAGAVAVGLGALAGGWIVYDLMCRSPLGRDDRWLAVGVVVFVTLLTWGLTQVLAGRAAFLHVGATLGTIMVGNVFFVIIPNQRRMVDAMRRGETPDPVLGLKGKQRSVHNTYFTLPVLFLMISNHYPALYGHPYSWAVLLGVGAVGALVRHAFVLRHGGRMRGWMPPAAAAAMVAVMVATAASRSLAPTPAVAAGGAGADADAADTLGPVVLRIVEQRCTACHAAAPSFDGFDEAPKGIRLETLADLRQWSGPVIEQAVTGEAMPLGNVTDMQPEERALLGRWLSSPAAAQGAAR
ncbi:urate hydroxylase PuuD [Caenispirillum bisanense]|uniref:urate hydroxylase PuuD n=1 Tax=Caenispirillum bisanense TaxID=414052 RepID=UPI0031D48BEC